MKYTPPFRIENGSIFEYDAENRAYIHIYKQSQLSKSELWAIKNQNKAYDIEYDRLKNK